jgi:hypothetical protein
MYFTSIKSGWSNLVFCIFFLGIRPSLAQINQVARIELPLLATETEYPKIATFKEKGIILYRTLLAPDANYVELQKLDTALKEQWKGAIMLDRKSSFFRAKTKEGFLVFLYWNKNSVTSNYQVLVVNEAKGSYGTYDINNAIPFNPTDFDVTGNSLIIGGYFNLRPIVLHFSFITKTTKVLPGYFNEPGEITELKTYINGSFDIIVRVKTAAKGKSLWLRNYDKEANLKSTIVLNSESRKNFIHGKSIQLENGNQLIAGTYGRNTEYARGLFFAVADSTGRSKVNYYNFSELKKFFSFLRTRKEVRIRERITRRASKGKQTKFSYRLILHDLIPYKNHFLLVAESYYPRYSYPTYSNRNVYNSAFTFNPYLNSNSTYRGDYVFDGFQYTHAVVAGFNRRANLLWDNSLEINDIKNMQLEQHVKVLPTENGADLVYLFENILHTKVIKDSLVIAPKKSIPIQLSNDEEEAAKKDGAANFLAYWYDDYLIASGVQRLRNKKLGRFAVERRVFYINKVKSKPETN